MVNFAAIVAIDAGLSQAGSKRFSEGRHGKTAFRVMLPLGLVRLHGEISVPGSGSEGARYGCGKLLISNAIQECMMVLCGNVGSVNCAAGQRV